MSFRNKASNSSQVFQPKQMNSSFEDSRIDSINSKRFTRKKQSPHESNRNSKNSKNTEVPITRTIQKSPSYGLIKPRVRLSQNVVRPQDLFLKIGSTPNKFKMITSNGNTDRTETTVPQQYGDNEQNYFIFNKQTTKKNTANDFQSELQIKNNELLIFEDENNRLKRDLQLKEELFLKEIKQKETEYHQSIHQLQQQIKALKEELHAKNQDLKAKNQEIKTLKKNEQQLTRDIKSLRYDKLMIQKQMQDLYKKKLSKETRQLMSFRQMSLMKQLDELKERMGQSKTHLEEKMEKEMNKLRETSIITDKKNQSLEILSLILHRKVEQTEKELKQQTDHFGKSYSQLVQSNRQLTDQLNKAKKEILKLRQLNLNKSTVGPRKRNIFVSSQLSDSLSFSFSN